MDHQDWPGWPEDDPHSDNADVADPGGHHGGLGHLDDDPLGHDPLGHDPLGHDPLGHDPLGHDPADGDPFTTDPGGYGDEAPRPGPGFDADTPAGEHEHDAIGEVYPDDDPFTPVHDATHHAADDATTYHVPDQHADGIVHDDPLPYQAHPVEHLVGADPDLDPASDAQWQDPAYPPPLDLPNLPEPVDGPPWSDPRLLGADITDAAVDTGDQHEPSWQQPHLGDLYDYAGDEQPTHADGWQALLGSDDPATGALARWWAPDS
jgi:hypothetical protein